MRLEELQFSEWGETLPDDGFGVFHTPEALRVVEKHTDGELRLYGGFKGDQAIGLLPVFVRRRSIAKAVLAPPPGLGIRRMGPLMLPSSPKRRKQEKENQQFMTSVLEHLDHTAPLTMVRITCNRSYVDPRPYTWTNFNVEPHFTYNLDLRDTTPDETIKSFSRSLRREIRQAEDLDVRVRIGDESDARKVYLATRNRWEEQGIGFPMSWEFMRDLLRALDDQARVYVAETEEGEFLGGIAVLYSNDTGFFWKGGTRGTYQDTSMTGLIHWHIIQDIISDPPRESIDWYDLYGANNQRLSQYKSKFNGELVPYYIVESPGLLTAVAKKAYRMRHFGEELFYLPGRSLS